MTDRGYRCKRRSNPAAHHYLRIGPLAATALLAAVGDGRGVELVLTDAGLDAVVIGARVHVTGVRRHLVDRLERSELIDLGATMAKVRVNL